MLVIVPNSLSDAISNAIDEALDGRPIDKAERQDIYNALLAYFDAHGVIPSFTLKERQEQLESEAKDD